MLPSLLDKRRRGSALTLGALALTQAAIAVLFADRIGHIAGKPIDGPVLVALAGLSLAAGGAMAAERWVAERFAQSYVADCRAALFDNVIRRRGSGNEARWLTGLVGDMTALRNYAMRGSIKLVTATLSGGGALLWLVIAYPTLRVAALPLIVALFLLMPITGRLAHAIGTQRQQRGRLNRFLIRRVRIEAKGSPCPKGHGRRKLAGLSLELAGKAVHRAQWVGALEAVAISAGMAASLLLVVVSRSVDSGTLVAALAITGFTSTRLLEGVRALHARIGGTVSIDRLSRMINRPIAVVTIPSPIGELP